MSQTEPRSDENTFVRFLKRKWLAIVLVVLFLIVAIQNAVGGDTATIFLLWGELRMPTWLLVLVIFLIGAVVGWILTRNRAARKGRR